MNRITALGASSGNVHHIGNRERGRSQGTRTSEASAARLISSTIGNSTFQLVQGNTTKPDPASARRRRTSNSWHNHAENLLDLPAVKTSRAAKRKGGVYDIILSPPVLSKKWCGETTSGLVDDRFVIELYPTTIRAPKDDRILLMPDNRTSAAELFPKDLTQFPDLESFREGDKWEPTPGGMALDFNCLLEEAASDNATVGIASNNPSSELPRHNAPSSFPIATYACPEIRITPPTPTVGYIEIYFDVDQCLRPPQSRKSNLELPSTAKPALVPDTEKSGWYSDSDSEGYSEDHGMSDDDDMTLEGSSVTEQVGKGDAVKGKKVVRFAV